MFSHYRNLLLWSRLHTNQEGLVRFHDFPLTGHDSDSNVCDTFLSPKNHLPFPKATKGQRGKTCSRRSCFGANLLHRRPDDSASLLALLHSRYYRRSRSLLSRKRPFFTTFCLFLFQFDIVHVVCPGEKEPTRV